jgi:effector-binding domain-containing protein
MTKAVKIVLLLILSGLLWYLFLKPMDYSIRFEAKANPGTINQALKLWGLSLDTVSGLRENGDMYHLSQKVLFGDSTHLYQWKITRLTDSTSKVVVGIKDLHHSFWNKIEVPFHETPITLRSKKTVKNFMEVLDTHIKNFKVTIIGEEEIPTKYIAYIPIQTKQRLKAKGMMKNFSYLTGKLFVNGVVLDGPPLLEITYWDMQNDIIHYNFGQPIIRSEKLPLDSDIKYKRVFPKRALKAVYNGNYTTSDRAWYALLDYAEKKQIDVDPKPIEIFFNKPMGNDELRWKADVYMPLK